MKKRRRSNGRALISALLIAAALFLPLSGTACTSGYVWGDTDLSEYSPKPVTAPPIELDPDGNGPAEPDTYTDYQLVGMRRLTIYDADYYGMYFDRPSVSPAEITAHIGENAKIPPQFKELLTQFTLLLASKYPEADLRPLDLNVRTLEVVECDPFELSLHAVSIDAYGCYVRTENTIYVPEGYEYKPGTWEYQVIMHEFGHMARTVTLNEDGIELNIWFSSENLTIPEEALNSIFTVSLFDYEERDIAYQLQSNMFLILTSCLDGYSLSDYMNHSLNYFLHMLDEQNGGNSLELMRLIEAQREDGVNDDYEREQQTYYPIYDYITRMYLDKNASPGMSSDEIRQLVDSLLDIIMFDVPPEYNIDTAEFYRFAEEYRAG